MAVFPIGMALLPVFLVFRFQSAHPSWFLFNCALPKIIQIYQILGFAGVCGFFAGVLRIVAGVLRAILGAVMCIYMRWCWDMRMAWYVRGTQPGCKPCSVILKMSLVVIMWPRGSKTRQSSRIRRNSENWVILRHSPKLPKIIDRKNVQDIYIYIYIQYTIMT